MQVAGNYEERGVGHEYGSRVDDAIDVECTGHFCHFSVATQVIMAVIALAVDYIPADVSSNGGEQKEIDEGHGQQWKYDFFAARCKVHFQITHAGERGRKANRPSVA